jgi:hypothetical protein
MQQLMREMDLVPFLFITGFLIVIATIAIVAGFHARSRAALVKSTPTSNIAMAQEGYCEFEGIIEAIPGAEVIAPLTQTPCAWFHARLEKWDSGTRQSSGSWQTVRDATSGSPFLLRDATGVCLVFPFLADVTPTDKSQWTGATAEPEDRNPPRVEPTGSTTPALQVTGTASSRFRYSEERIYVGDPLLVLGEFSRRQFEPDDEGEDEDDEAIDDADDAAGSADDDADDDADDGGADWDDAREDDATERAEQITRACIRKGSGSKPFIVTTTPQAAHVYMSEVGGQTAYYGAAFALGIVVFLAYLRYG